MVSDVTDVPAPEVCVLVIDGLPVDLLEAELPALPFLRERCPHRSTAVSCFPSTTGPAYFPLLAGVTPGRANVTGIRWFDRTRSTPSRFPHRGLRSYVGPDARRMVSDTKVPTMLGEHAWPASTPVAKDSPKKTGEKSRDALWAFAHFTHRWDLADRRTAWKLGRAQQKGRPIVFAVFPSVDEYGHTLGFGDEMRTALHGIDAMLQATLGDFGGELLVTADHGLTPTEHHIDLRAEVAARVGATIAFPLIGTPDPAAVVCESGNGMAHVYLGASRRWQEVPTRERCLELAEDLRASLPGIDSIAIRDDEAHHVTLLHDGGPTRVWWTPAGFGYETATGEKADGLDPAAALAETADWEHPDAPFSLVSLFASERTGDVLVSARVGHDLRTAREWPTHHASHGALHRHHTTVPVLASSPLPATPLRTIDCFPLALERAGLDPHALYPRSDAALIAAGTWAPGVDRGD